jgi:DNA modification methylase
MTTTKLINGEAIAELQKLDNESIDHIIVDLPYGVTSNKWDAVIPFEDMWAEFNRVIKHGGNIVLFAIQPFASMLITSNIKNYKYELIWQKTNPSGQLLSGSRPLRKHENILIFQKNKNKGIIYNPQKTTGHNPTNVPLVTKKSEKDSNWGEHMNGREAYSEQFKAENKLGIKHPTTIIDETALAGKKIGQTYNPQKTTGHAPTSAINGGSTGDNYKGMSRINKEGNDNLINGVRHPTSIIDDEALAGKKIGQIYNPQMSEGHEPAKPKSSKDGGPGSNYGDFNWEPQVGNDNLINGVRYPTSIIEFKNPRMKLKGAVVNHPTKKPVDLMQYLVRQYSNEGDTILDCCMGGGSTGVACVRENRNFIGIELNEEYFAGASEWINNENRGI